MSATITVSVRFPLKQAAQIKRAAKVAGVKLATFVRDGAHAQALITLATVPTDAEREAVEKANA